MEIIGCPIASSMGVLGHKWAMVIMRDAVMMQRTRFRDFLQDNPGLTPRVLSRRLQDLVEAGYLAKQGTEERPTYAPTAKGADLAPVLTALAAFGLQHHADQVFADGQPRPLEAFVTV
ncbi:MAG: winged helix-turn-helix transcriptional regulator [Thermoplasmatota archaeon]